MSEILNLAKDYEAKLKERAKTTRESVQNALSEHESALTQCLEAEHRKMQRAISAHSNRVIWSMAGTWVTTIVLVLCLIGASAGVLIWQGKEIASRYEQLDKLPSGAVTQCGDQRRLCIEIDPTATEYGKNGEYRIIKGG
ncbi:hypothetical protein SFW44_004559 [Salmonella enterica subsp. enterica serovar Enteritidis]|nr:hypothetical protein [Salmonella enterica subsp. enterica serovar Kentucky]EJR2725181.1 hypothetical protein [Salmonella enterica subsp. enterica serovar Kentucky]EJT2726902.1 hypothetical protein [Salmonella enterica subsp. enterica serovar Kentucky]